MPSQSASLTAPPEGEPREGTRGSRGETTALLTSPFGTAEGKPSPYLPLPLGVAEGKPPTYLPLPLGEVAERKRGRRGCVFQQAAFRQIFSLGCAFPGKPSLPPATRTLSVSCADSSPRGGAKGGAAEAPQASVEPGMRTAPKGSLCRGSWPRSGLRERTTAALFRPHFLNSAAAASQTFTFAHKRGILIL